ncbi:hypothetical protein GQ54DRAFT_289616 [Martensiomyces pterosporus]|nr:hypothetical protein GQ54DRAFT_289616 [Martensiomyces pterosporus]
MMSNILLQGIQEVLSGPSDSSFIRSLLDEHASILALVDCVLQNRVSQKDELVATPKAEELALSVYEKLCGSLLDAESQALTRDLQDRYILVGATLFDLARVFGISYPDRVQHLLYGLWHNAPWLTTEIEAAFDLFVEQLAKFQETCSLRSGPQQATSLAWLGNLCAGLKWQLSMAESWQCLVEHCVPSASVLLQDNRSMVKLSQAYDVATQLMLDISSQSHHDCADLADQCKELVKRLKWQWTGIAFRVCKALLDANNSSHVGVEMDQRAPYKIFMDLLDNIETAETVLTPFTNAPFLLDLEFRFGIRQMLRHAAAASNAFDEAQVDYIIMSTDQLVDMAAPLYRHGLESLEQRAKDAQAPVSDTDNPIGSGDSFDHTMPRSTYSNEAEAAAAQAGGDEDASSISQIQELMPDLGTGFIRACLSYYDHSAEAVIVAVLEDNLPPSLAALDRAMMDTPHTATTTTTTSTYATADEAAERLLSNRRNIFDNDEFDIFHRGTLDWSRVHRGKAESPAKLRDASADVKSRVMQIAQRIEEDDEYDDTYDDTAQDGAVIDTPDADEYLAAAHQSRSKDSLHGESSAAAADTQTDPTRAWEEVLVRQYTTDPTVFERKKEKRKLPARQALRQQTGLSDEQLEGWYVMFQRNPRRQQMADRYEWRGEQPAAEHRQGASGNRSAPGGAASERKQQSAKSEPSDLDRKRKEKNKAKVGNHRRKQQHDRKMRSAVPGSN